MLCKEKGQMKFSKQRFDVYIASCCKDGGVYHYHLQGEELAFVDKTQMDQPMYLTPHNDLMYIPLREPFKNSKESGMAICPIHLGRVQQPKEILPTRGKVCCHEVVDGSTVYAVNYLSGNVVKLPDLVITHTGKSVHPTRQETAHTHFVCITPDGYLLITDLGLDKIFTYTKSLQLVCETSTAPGDGPRHLVFSSDGTLVYCANELASTVSVYAYQNGRLALRGTVSTLPSEYLGENTAAAIRISRDNTILYVSNRGHDSLACFGIEEDQLKLQEIVPCGGRSPRDFCLVENLLICTNEASDNVTIFRREKERLQKLPQELYIPSPLCAAVVASQ